MSARTRSRLVVVIAIAAGPVFAIGACGGDVDDAISGPQDDGATDGVAIDTSTSDGALEAASRDASKTDADGDPDADAGGSDAAKTLNRCGGYTALELDGGAATPGDSCGACGDGTIACIGSDTVTCAGASSAPCPMQPVDAGPNACGGYGPLTFLFADASIGDPCGECGSVQCASSTSLACTTHGSGCPTDAGLQSTCVVPDSAYTATAPSPTLPAETRPTSTSTSSIALPASDLAFNPYDGLLYASISPGVSQGNSIAAIDPMSASVLRTVYVGPSPTHIALSDDGHALWVVLSGASAIRRVDLTTFTAGRMFTQPPGPTVSSLQVVAGTEDSVAVTRRGGEFSTIVYDNGTPRPYGVRNSNWTQGVATASASLLLLTEVSSGPSGNVSSLCVDSDGAFARGPAGKSRYYDGPPAFFEGVLYDVDGISYDGRTAAPLHTFDVPRDFTKTLVTADVKDVYYLTSLYKGGMGSVVAVTGFDRITYAETTTDPLAANGGTNRSFTRWGRYGFAYLNGSTSIEIARSTIIPDQP